jgi:hypothetical protein
MALDDWHHGDGYGHIRESGATDQTADFRQSRNLLRDDLISRV